MSEHAVMKGRLNLFQAAMLRWRELHPYNAVHIVELAQRFDRSRLERAIATELESMGLTGLTLDRARRRYEYRGGPATFELEIVAQDADTSVATRVEIERQLNRPFPLDGAIDPFRFFVFADGERFRVGLAYDHFVAGGDSIVVLLNNIVDRYVGTVGERASPALYPPTFRRLVVREAAAFIAGLGALPRIAASCRRGKRPRYDDDTDGYNAFDYIALPAPSARAMQTKARALGVTFNDLLIALTLKALASEFPAAARRGRRREVAVASIFNLRGASRFDSRDAFGQFLSSMRISHSMPDELSLDAVARDVHRETERFKNRKLYLQMLLAVRINAIVWWFLDLRQRQRFYAKAYPVLAGLTSLNVDALWRRPDGATAPDYLRAVPTGPIAPLVIAATTCGGAVAFGFSYRRSGLDAGKIARIARYFAESVRAFQ